MTLLIVAAGVLLFALLLAYRAPLPLIAYSGVLLLIAVGGSGFFESKPRFLLPAFPLLIPLARALFQLGRTAEAEAYVSALAAEAPRDARMCDLLAELLVEQSDLVGALGWANAGVELCLGRTPAPVGQGNEVTPAGPITQVSGDVNEFRLLLSLRFRIRNDLGLPEDDYDRLLDTHSGG